MFSRGWNPYPNVTLTDGTTVSGRFWVQIGIASVISENDIVDPADKEFCEGKYGQGAEVFCFKFEKTPFSEDAESECNAVKYRTPRALEAAEKRKLKKDAGNDVTEDD